MRAVLDTVVFVRALINQQGRWGRLLFQYCDRYTIVLSPEIVREVLEVLYRSSLRERFPQIDEVSIDRILVILERAEVIEDPPAVRVCRDANDDKFFACARTAAADFIVSEDTDILAISEYEGARTISTAEFIHLLSDD